MIPLPVEYIRKMEEYLGEQAEAFLASYNYPRTQGLRINPLIMSPADHVLSELVSLFHLSPVPWCATGFYYEGDARPGKHPYHAAGAYYIQEPSAMSAVELLSPNPGDVVLDLAAAPGGKSTQIAGKLRGEGMLIANEIHPVRAKIVSENIERCGVRNCIVTCSRPEQLAARFPHFFDKIMVDAPCSGEGMFRKDPQAIHEWTPGHVRMCAARQLDILDQAAPMLKSGGTLAYSTCTFSPEENEATIEAFVRKYPEFSVITMERIWPHLHRGEGHFVALLKKQTRGDGSVRSHDGGGMSDRGDSVVSEHGRGMVSEHGLGVVSGHSPGVVSDHGPGMVSGHSIGRGNTRESRKLKSGNLELTHRTHEALKLFNEFAEDYLPGFKLFPGEPILFGEQLYWLPYVNGDAILSGAVLHGLRVLRPGLHLATMKKSRIEPAHALALAVHPNQVRLSLLLPPDAEELHAYLRGESLAVDNYSGWVLIGADHFSLGWGKGSNGQIKNHYPKGLRWLG